ncbi:MAG: SDR family NAD(P)-dependent oxidoreductase [Candidatus Adiutrix sp.]|jgi:acyl transferase domain-containing protein|nr:SDR family NAD(P)-dependent oxidoreductase [Candidatus Adiutrix sp.]
MTPDSASKNNKTTAVAIIGLGCLFPGADSIAGYWAAIKECRDSISDVPADHWSVDDYYDPDPKAADKTYGRRGGFLSKVDFEPLRYGIAPNDLSAIDATQLLGLVAADRALADAGYGADSGHDHGRTAVMLGVTGALKMVVSLGSRLAHPQLRRALADSGVSRSVADEVLERFAAEFAPWQENSFPGLLGNVAAGRIANRLNLGGGNMAVDAACASSLAALRQGVMELSSGQADLVVTGGLDTFSDPFMYTCFSKTPALSPAGEVRPYDQDGDGTLLGDGIGVMVLKRLDEARRDGDRICAVIKAIGASSDGRGTAIFAPSVEGQVRALESAFSQAEISPATVELVEGHGTGTAVGDAVEVAALTRVFAAARPASGATGTSDAARPDPWCALGSVKAQIGHTKAAAGAAGLIKAALALYFKVLPPAAKVKKPLAELAREGSPFYLSSCARPWPRSSAHPRRAGVSAFGFGGSNFHCLLEENSPAKPAAEAPADLEIFAFSAASEADLASRLQEAEKTGEQSLGALARVSRTAFNSSDPARLIIVSPRGLMPALARRLQDLSAASGLAGANLPGGVFWGSGRAQADVYGFLYPGPAAAYRNMFLELACDWPEMLEALSRAEEELARAEPGLPRLSLLLYPPDLASDGRQAAWAKAFAADGVRRAAVTAVSRGLTDLLRKFGLKPSAAIGEAPDQSFSAGQTNVAQELNRKAHQGIDAWLEIGPGRALSQEARAALGPAARVLALDQDGGGRLSLARFLGQLAAWGLPVDFRAWPDSPASAEETDETSRAFTVPISGANYFVKKEKPAPARKPAVAENPAEAVNLLENMMAETARLHQEFLNYQAEALQLMRQSLGNHASPVPAAARAAAPRAISVARAASAPASEAGSPSSSVAGLILETVAAETGYPVDMLNLDMNLETDLGLDSIKKVEIMAALSEKMPSIQDLGAESLNSLTTLGDLARLAAPFDSPPAVAGRTPEKPAADAWPLLKRTVARETGYPPEMLAPHLSLADDLGLDSIKLVEIVSAISEQLPAAETLSAETLGAARTLGDLAAALAAGAAPAARAATPPVAPAKRSTDDLLMEVLSAETGYPVDMLNLDMNLESDLGLDSIKKVEIMAALSERLPGAEALGTAEALNEAETLRDLSRMLAAGGEARPAAVPAAAPSADQARLLLDIVAAETGYPADMLSFEADLETDLGLDSIKKVEIMAALNEKLGAGGDQASPSTEALNEARTLGDLHNILSGRIAPGYRAERISAPAPPPAPVPARAPEAPAPPPKRKPGRPPKNSPPAFKEIAAEPSADELTTGLSYWRVEPAPLKRLKGGAEPQLPPAGATVWVLADGGRLPDELTRVFTDKGLKAKTIRWGETGRLDELPPPEALVIIWPGAEYNFDLAAAAFRVIRAAGQRLSAAAREGLNPLIMGLTFMGGSFALSEKGAAFSPASASLCGLIKTVAREWPGVRARAIDLPPAAYGSEAPRYIGAILDACSNAAPVEVGIRGPEELNTPSLSAYKLKNIRVRHLREGQTLIVTGGARGVTAAAIKELARSLRPNLVILGRTPLAPVEPSWLRELKTESEIREALFQRAAVKPGPRELARESAQIIRGRELRENLAAFEKAGARATYISGEMGRETILRAAVKEIRQKHGPIHGFIHGAGVLADSLILDKKDEDFALVFNTKARLAAAILEELRDEPLNLLAFFSSSSARFGRKGQADYAAGNEVLNKMAQAAMAAHRGIKCLSVNWGPWEGGMVTPSLANLFEKEGIGLIPMLEGAKLFSTLVGTPKNDPAEVVVLGPGASLAALDGRPRL